MARSGINETTGQPLADTDHLIQSIGDILSTPIGSRVNRRDYGSRLFELADRPVNASWITDAYAATAEALMRWEPQLRPVRFVFDLSELANGLATLDMYAFDLTKGDVVTIEGISVTLRA